MERSYTKISIWEPPGTLYYLGAESVTPASGRNSIVIKISF